MDTPPPLVAHIVYRFALGGLERNLARLINRMPRDRYRHAILCLTDFTDFRKRIERPDVPVLAIHQKPGHDPGVYFRVWRALRRLKPDIVHTHNLAALEFQAIAALAGVRARIHGEFGRDVYDLEGANPRYKLLRKAMRPFVDRYVTVTEELADWLRSVVGANPALIRLIPRGVDLEPFEKRGSAPPQGLPPGFTKSGRCVIGSVGRMAEVKDYPSLVAVFLSILRQRPAFRESLRLIIAGDGPERQRCIEMLRSAGAEELAWLPGSRDDVPAILGCLDIFVLTSLAEGMPNSILEAMAAGLPVVATGVGGVPELVLENATGATVELGDPDSLQEAVCRYIDDPDTARAHGRRGRERVKQEYSVEKMIDRYTEVFDEVTAGRNGR